MMFNILFVLHLTLRLKRYIKCHGNNDIRNNIISMNSNKSFGTPPGKYQTKITISKNTSLEFLLSQKRSRRTNSLDFVVLDSELKY